MATTHKITSITRKMVDGANGVPAQQVEGGKPVWLVTFDVTTDVKHHPGNVYEWPAASGAEITAKVGDVAAHIELEEAAQIAALAPVPEGAPDDFAALVGG